MKKLTNKEREVMELFWQHGPMFVRELLEHYEEPRPHFNTLSTIVRRLEHQGNIGHKQYGSTYQYHALISEQDYAKSNIFSLVDDYIKDTYKGIVSAFLKEEKLSVDELMNQKDYDEGTTPLLTHELGHIRLHHFSIYTY